MTGEDTHSELSPLPNSYKWGIIQFLGSNGDHDADYALGHLLGQQPHILHPSEQYDLGQYDAVFLPGGFSYGDYLRAGTIAAVSNHMDGIKEFAAEGKPVLGICNGFQILT